MPSRDLGSVEAAWNSSILEALLPTAFQHMPK